MTHHDHESSLDGVEVSVVTVSSSRSLDDDPAGDAVVAAIEGTQATVADRELVADDRTAVAGTVIDLIAAGADAVVTTGGTGLTPDDVTVEAMVDHFDLAIPGFGEFFRRRSAEEVGTAAMASRATAGVVDGAVVFCLPGSEHAARFGTEKLIVPELGHLVRQASGDAG